MVELPFVPIQDEEAELTAKDITVGHGGSFGIRKACEGGRTYPNGGSFGIRKAWWGGRTYPNSTVIVVGVVHRIQSLIVVVGVGHSIV